MILKLVAADAQILCPVSDGGVPGGVLDSEFLLGGVSGMVGGGMQPKHTMIGLRTVHSTTRNARSGRWWCPRLFGTSK